MLDAEGTRQGVIRRNVQGFPLSYEVLLNSELATAEQALMVEQCTVKEEPQDKLLSDGDNMKPTAKAWFKVFPK